MSDDFNPARDRLRQILGNRMADKLVEESKSAAATYAKNLSDLTTKTLKDRMSLTDDELVEPRFDLVREEAAEILKSLMGVFISCQVVNLSCVLHNALETSMTSYVTHVVGHYEAEQKKRKLEKVVSLVEALRDNEPDDNDIHHAAKAHSSGN